MDAHGESSLEGPGTGSTSKADPVARRVMVIGLDGAAWKTINALIQKGELRNIREMTEKGVYGELKSTVPPLTGPAWVSFATGKNPGKHGVFDFFLVTNSLTNRRYVSTRDVSADMFYEILERRGKRCIIMNLPISFPPRIKGTVIDSITARSESIFSPKDLPNAIPILQKYRIVPEGVVTERLREFREIERTRFDCARELLKMDWDFFFVLFLLSDAVQHRFYDRIIDGTLADPEAIKAWKDLDEYVGWFIRNFPRDTILVISDHGFRVSKKKFAVNRWLMESGYLKAKPMKNVSAEKPSGIQIPDLLLRHPKMLNAAGLLYRFLGRPADLEPVVQEIEPDPSQSVAYATGTMSGPVGGIFINARDRYRDGIVESHDYEDLRDRLIRGLTDLKDKSGRPVLRYVLRREDIYWGSCLERGPDMIIGSDEYSITTRNLPVVSDRWRGERNDHAREGIFIAYGRDVGKGRNIVGATIYDIAPTILHLFGFAVPKDMDGRVLKEIFVDDSEIANREVVYGSQISTTR